MFIFTPVMLLIIKLTICHNLIIIKQPEIFPKTPGTPLLIKKLTPAKIHNVPKQISVLILNYWKPSFSLFDGEVDFKFHPVTCVSFYHMAVQ